MHEVWEKQNMKMPGKCTGPKYLFKNWRKWVKRYLGAMQRMGPTMLNYCRPEQVGTEEHGKMLQRIQILEDARVPAKEAEENHKEGIQ